MKIYLATWLFEHNHGVSLTKIGARKRLLSYFFIKEQKVSAVGMNKYVKTGELKTGKDDQF
jgi:hypothetical protein